MYWLDLCVNLTQAGVIREMSLVWEFPPRDITVGHVFQLVIKSGGSLMDLDHLWTCILRLYKRAG